MCGWLIIWKLSWKSYRSKHSISGPGWCVCSIHCSSQITFIYVHPSRQLIVSPKLFWVCVSESLSEARWADQTQIRCRKDSKRGNKSRWVRTEALLFHSCSMELRSVFWVLFCNMLLGQIRRTERPIALEINGEHEPMTTMFINITP